MRDYQGRVEDLGNQLQAPGAVLRALPRQPKIRIEQGADGVPMFRSERFTATVWATLARFGLWIRLLMAFRLGVLGDRMRRRDSMDRRAERLLALFRRAGGTFIKLGQQLSMRVDMLPYEYCRELGKLTDAIEPFPPEVGIGIIERTTGQKLSATFCAFDPQPIGSASIACVYQAVLHNGHKVAVKVRRPEVGYVFAADIRAIRWLIGLLESLSLLRAGNLDHFVNEFEDAIMEELDFTMEAYHQSIYRRAARKCPLDMDFLGVPAVYYELSSREVLVQEFVTGMWMWEVLAAVEQRDPVALRRMRELDIDPATLAERVHFVGLWSMMISDIYHADPHPANIVVQRGNVLVFIDFGACGSIDRVKKDITREIMQCQIRKDVKGLVDAMITAMEPLPHIDVDSLAKEAEIAIAKNLRKLWSKHAPWYEKTSAANWLALFALIQRYNVPASLDTVRAFRAQMLYDTLAVRVHPPIDTTRTVKRFLERADKMNKRRTRKLLDRRMADGLFTGSDLRSLQGIGGMFSRGMLALRRLIDSPRHNYGTSIEKSVSTVLELGRYLAILGVGTTLGVLATAIRFRANELPLEFGVIVLETVTSRAYLVIAGILTLISLRRIGYRLRDQDI